MPTFTDLLHLDCGGRWWLILFFSWARGLVACACFPWALKVQHGTTWSSAYSVTIWRHIKILDDSAGRDYSLVIVSCVWNPCRLHILIRWGRNNQDQPRNLLVSLLQPLLCRPPQPGRIAGDAFRFHLSHVAQNSGIRLREPCGTKKQTQCILEPRTS